MLYSRFFFLLGFLYVSFTYNNKIMNHHSFMFGEVSVWRNLLGEVSTSNSTQQHTSSVIFITCILAYIAWIAILTYRFQLLWLWWVPRVSMSLYDEILWYLLIGNGWHHPCAGRLCTSIYCTSLKSKLRKYMSLAFFSIILVFQSYQSSIIFL